VTTSGTAASAETDPLAAAVRRWRRWPPWAWFALVAVSAAGTAWVLVSSMFIVLAGQSLCEKDPNPVDAAGAQHDLALLALGTLAVWCLLAVVVRPRVRVLVAGLVCACPALLLWLDGTLSADAYRGGWCF